MALRRGHNGSTGSRLHLHHSALKAGANRRPRSQASCRLSLHRRLRLSTSSEEEVSPHRRGSGDHLLRWTFSLSALSYLKNPRGQNGRGRRPKKGREVGGCSPGPKRAGGWRQSTIAAARPLLVVGCAASVERVHSLTRAFMTFEGSPPHGRPFVVSGRPSAAAGTIPSVMESRGGAPSHMNASAPIEVR